MATANVATNSGRSILWNFVKAGAGAAEPKNIGWGTGASASVSPAQIFNVNLFAPQTEVRVAGASTLTKTAQLADTYQVIGTLTCAVAAKTITEAGLFDTTTLSVSMTAATTVVGLGAASGIATSSYYRQIELETVLVTAGSNSTTETI